MRNTSNNIRHNTLLMATAMAVFSITHNPYPRAGKLKASMDEDSWKKLPEAVQEFYAKDEESGKYLLSTDDKDFKKSLDEFRGANVTLKKRQEELVASLKKFEGVDPEKWAEAKEALDWLETEEDAKLLKAGKIDDVVNRRTQKMREEQAKEFDKLKKERDELLKSRDSFSELYDGMLLDTTMSETIRGVANPKNGAMTDLLRRARDTFQRDPENPKKIKARDGMLNKDNKAYTPEEWAKQMVADAPFFFESGSGGGSGGGNRGQGGGTGKVLRNPTAAEYGQHAAAIAKGEMTVVRDNAG